MTQNGQLVTNQRTTAMNSKDVLPGTATPAQSPTPVTGDPQDMPQTEPRFAHEDWKRKVLQDMNNLDRDPDRVSALRKRIF